MTGPGATSRPFLERLPAVFHIDEVQGQSFLGRFLLAFEEVLTGLQAEIEAIPSLFTLTPTPVLADPLAQGKRELRLDSAAGLCPGDLLVLNPLPGSTQDPGSDASASVEIVRVDETGDGAPGAPTSVTLSAATRFPQQRGVRVLVLGASGRTSALARPVVPAPPALPQTLAVTDADTLGARRGDVVAVGVGAEPEYAQVSLVQGAVLTVVPPFGRRHEAGEPVAVLSAAPVFTPPPHYRSADRSGPEILLTAPVLAGESVLEVDTVAGLQVGDVLHLRDPDPARTEFARVAALLPQPSPVAVRRRGVTTSRPLRFDHPADTETGVLGEVGSGTALSRAAAAGVGVLDVEDSASLGGVGSVLQVGEGDHVQLLRVSGSLLSVTPAVAVGHATGAPVRPVAVAGGGTALLSWLAGWIGLVLRPNRGERWNRELLRLAGRIWPFRGTRAGVEAFLVASLRGEAARTVVHDASNPMQVGLVSTLGEDTFVCGGPAGFFWADLYTEPGNSRLYHPLGLDTMVQAAHEALRHERPAHTYYDLQVFAKTMQLGTNADREVGARVGDTTLLWDRPLIRPGDR
jgi:hypothetical protein